MGSLKPQRHNAGARAYESCIAYVRYSPRPSVNRNAAGEAETMEGQTDRCRKFAEARGWTVLAVRKDEEKTGRGSGKNRSGLMQAIEECKRAGAVLVIAKLDRLSRNVAFLAALMESGVDFVAVDNPNANKLTLHVMAAMAEYESDQISERTRAAMAAMQQGGRVISSSAPFGWKMGEAFDAGRGRGVRYMMVEDEAEQRVLKRLRKLAASGITVYAVAKRLNDEGMAGRGGVKWCSVKINRILRRDRDAGGVFNPMPAA